MKKSDLDSYFEFHAYLPDTQKTFTCKQLLEAVDLSQVKTFGWPIAPVMDYEPHKPVPTTKGIKAQIETDSSYDFWTISKTAEFYTLKSLFEGKRKPEKIFLDTRIIRTAEALMRTAAFYTKLKFLPNEKIVFKFKYGGLSGKLLSVASPNRMLSIERKCQTDIYEFEEIQSIEQLNTLGDLQSLVFRALHPFFELFDFFAIDRPLVDDIIDNYSKGRVR